MLKVSFSFHCYVRFLGNTLSFQSKVVTVSTLHCILTWFLLLKFGKALSLREKAMSLVSTGCKDLSRCNVSNSFVLIYMKLFHQVIISYFRSTACLKPELNKLMKYCINGAFVKNKNNKIPKFVGKINPKIGKTNMKKHADLRPKCCKSEN